MRGGRLTRFASFITGELYAALSGSFVARLAETAGRSPKPARPRLPRRPHAGGGLTRALFQARTRVLAGDMSPRAVRPFLSRLLIETEIAGAAELFGGADLGPSRRGRAAARASTERVLEARGLKVTIIDPAAATLAGLNRIMAARA